MSKGVEIISSGGTAEYLQEKQLSVTKVENLTGFREILDGRVKTMHPSLHGAILAQRTPDHLHQLEKLGIEPIDMVIVNLYPFVDNLATEGHNWAKMIDLIDIGGPALIRAAAKNHKNVVVLHQPKQYSEFLNLWKENKFTVPVSYSKKLASDAFFYTSYYDSKIAQYFDSTEKGGNSPERLAQFFVKKQDLRYGENPHQKATLYQSLESIFAGQEGVLQLWGKEMSYNNFVDVVSAIHLVAEFEEPTVAIIKHTNPCGVASNEILVSAFQNARNSDPISAFGGIVAINRTVDEQTASLIHETFFECIVAPDYSDEALKIIKEKKNIRILKTSSFLQYNGEIENKYLPLGLLTQEKDLILYDPTKLQPVTDRSVSDEEMEDLIFAWKVAKHVKSNAIVFAKNKQVLGIGAGQMSRVDAVKLADLKAKQFKHELHGAVMASDAFFPFRDGVDEAAKSGISAVIQPGGSIRDEEVITAINENRMAMLFTGIRHFKH
jgi:phosphoribosylaminoimidazolecarboxamide formyltransferase/IMP cyclohydrolase